MGIKTASSGSEYRMIAALAALIVWGNVLSRGEGGSEKLTGRVTLPPSEQDAYSINLAGDSATGIIRQKFWTTNPGGTYTLRPAAFPTTLILPSGMTGNGPNFIWCEISSASWYYLWVNGPSGTPVIQQWYTAAQAKCGGGDCAVPTPIMLADGSHTWWVQTWNSSGYGPWSAGMPFTVNGCGPGATALIQPYGGSANPPPWYWWYDAGNASWYYLWVNGSSGTAVIQKWYTSAQASCNGKW